MRSILFFLASLVLLALADYGSADVVSRSSSGFRVKSEAIVGGAAENVYDILVKRIDRWWDPAHTFSGDSRNLTLDAKPGGCFCESLPNNGGVRHLEVVFVSPGKSIRMIGALGPLQDSGLAGSMTWSFQEHDDSTKVELSYSVGGHYQGDIHKLAPIVDSVLHTQLLRLKAYAETGSPQPK